MEFLLIIGIFESIFLAALIFSQKEKNASDKFLGGFFLLYAVNFALSYLEFYNRTHAFPHPAFIVVAPPLILLHGPALWSYVKSLTDQHFRFRPVYLLHLLPFFFMVVEMWINVYSLPVERRIQLITSNAITNKISYKIFVVAIALSTMGYFSWCLNMVIHYRKKIRAYFSQIENIGLNWLKVLLTSILIVYGLINTVYILDLFMPIASFGLMQFFSFGFGAVYIVFLGFFGLRQGNVFSSGTISLNLEKALGKEPGNRKLESREEWFIQELLNYMREKKPHLNPDLTVAGLSKKLDVTPEYLSRVINTRLNKNFFDFVNHFRIEEFKRKAGQFNKNFTIVGLAFECGFNSKATFNRVFKKMVGCTPGDFIKPNN
jgi:AraC-like DNA-binding protein